MGTSRCAQRLLAVGLLSVALSVSASSRVAEAAELYLSGDLRGSFVSPELGGYLNVPPGPPASISGQGDDWGFVFGMALGMAQPLEAWQFRGRSLEGWALRGEVEFDLWREYRVSTPGPLGSGWEATAHIEARTLLANFWLDFPVHRKLSGHAGFGVGMTGADVSGANRLNPAEYHGYRREREFAFQVGAGLEYPVLDYVSVLVGYRYVNLGGFEVNLVGTSSSSNPTGRIHLDLSSHELLAGLRLSFDFVPSPFD